ncbi:MAG TPA: hypothetical protein VNT92_12575, partial [Acidimicrobiia bacterium]|nr:hypothetical protein [Acidimicrobiia bacterium]
MRTRSIAVVMAGAIALGACADTTTGSTLPEGQAGDPTVASEPSGTGPAMEAITEFQAEIDELSDAISESEAAEDLSAAWETLNTELAAAMAAIQEDGAVAREEIESGLETFEQRLDELDV